MSQINNNNFTADGNQTSNNFTDQIPFKTTEGNHSGNQLFIVIDFHVRHLYRAFFCVPVKRNKGLATLANGSVINEKQLCNFGDFLNLRERVELRKRVVGYKHVLFFPRWDLDGPDLRYFGDWNPEANINHPSTCFKAGPWVLDGRQMVADAKDIGLMLAEAVVYQHQDNSNVNIYIQSPFSTEFISQREWNLGKGPFDAFWSGIRKAADVLHTNFPYLQFIAVSETNPFHELTKACYVVWKKPEEVELNDGYYAVPGDPFGIIGQTAEEEAIMTQQGISNNFLMHLFSPTTKLAVSNFVKSFRTPLWNPSTRLSLLQTRQQNKTKWTTPMVKE